MGEGPREEVTYREAVRLLNKFLSATPKLLRIVATHDPDHAETFSNAIQLLALTKAAPEDVPAQVVVTEEDIDSDSTTVANDLDNAQHREPVPRTVFDFCVLLFLTMRKVHTTKKQVWTALLTAGLDVGEYSTCAQRLATNLKDNGYITWPPKGHNGAVLVTEAGRKYLIELSEPGEKGLGTELVEYYKVEITQHIEELVRAPILRTRTAR